ncbi:MAG TPA: hypothetical protein VE035_04470 [Puia sp.]|nr:hypothetical protein [Puia sp.]
MKQLAIATLSLYLALTSSQAQNTFPATGNVGIGTSSPAYPLDVTGNTRVGGTTFINTALQVTGNPSSWPAGQGIQLAYTGSIGYLTSYDNTAQVFMPLTLRGNTINFHTYGKVFPTGNWSISSSPVDAGFKLDVAGSARFSGPVYVAPAQYITASSTGNWDFINGGGGGWYFRWIQNGATPMTLSTGNNLLLGSTVDGGYRLDVTGTTRLQGAVRFSGLTADNTQAKILASDVNGNLFLRDASTLGGGGAGWSLTGNAAVNPASGFLGTTDASALAFRTSNIERIRVDAAGNVGIGTTAPQSLLAVKGTITSQKMVVTQTGWADYVFQPAYRLPSLSHIEKFIREQHHLPDVPSESEIAAAGNDLGANQAVLLKKIEELTLYIIAQDKKLQDQQARIERLERQDQRRAAK